MLAAAQWVFLNGALLALTYGMSVATFRERSLLRGVTAVAEATIVLLLFVRPPLGAWAAVGLFVTDLGHEGWQRAYRKQSWRPVALSCLLLTASVIAAAGPSISAVRTTGLPHVLAIAAAELALFISIWPPLTSSQEAEFSTVYQNMFRRLVVELSPAFPSTGQAVEAVQDSFARAHLRWQRVRRSDPETWIRCAALRRAARGPLPSPAIVAQLSATFPTGHEPAQPDDAASAWLADAFRQLSRRQREAFLLYHVARLPVPAIAQHLGTSEGVIATRLSRSTRRLAGHDPIDLDLLLDARRDPNVPDDTLPDIHGLVRRTTRYRWRRTVVTIALVGLLAEATGQVVNAVIT